MPFSFFPFTYPIKPIHTHGLVLMLRVYAPSIPIPPAGGSSEFHPQFQSSYWKDTTLRWDEVTSSPNLHHALPPAQTILVPSAKLQKPPLWHMPGRLPGVLIPHFPSKLVQLGWDTLRRPEQFSEPLENQAIVLIFTFLSAPESLRTAYYWTLLTKRLWYCSEPAKYRLKKCPHPNIKT